VASRQIRAEPERLLLVALVLVKGEGNGFGGVVYGVRRGRGGLGSRFVGNMTLNVQSEPPFPKDEKLNLKPPAGTDPNSKPTITEFSDQLRKELLIEHMKQILGGLNQ
jgi:hypothetical protein